MRQIAFSGLLIFGMLQVAVIRSQSNIQCERYAQLSEKYFDKQNFDSCLHFNYILAHYYTQNNDTIDIVTTWYNIGIINLLQKKPAQANGAQIIANQYISIKNNETYDQLKSIYNSILNFKRLPTDLTGFGNLSGLF